MERSEYLDLLYEPCLSKEELKQHIKTFIKVDLPDVTIDENSNSNPMELIYSVYETMRTGKGPQRIVVAAARNTMKTLSAAILRFYSMIHFRRSGTHLAATADQSQSLILYLDKFLGIDGVAEFIGMSNTRAKVLEKLPPNSFTKNGTCSLRIAIATKAGVNSQRGSFNTRDELELIPIEIIRESSFISDPTNDEHRFGPIEMELSSRKIADGPLQEKIDEASQKDPPADLRLHFWALSDFMQRCPDEIHEPEKPRKLAYMNMDTLETIWEQDQYDAMKETEKLQYNTINTYHGCRTCPAFIACQSRAPKQTGTSKALRDISFVNLILKAVKDPDTIISQALNLRPGKSGQVFRMFRKYRHVKKPIEAYKWMFGEYYNPSRYSSEKLQQILKDRPWEITPTLEIIYQKLKEERWDLVFGVDWGYFPARAVVTLWAYHKRTDRAVGFHTRSTQHMANKDFADYICKDVWTTYPGDYVAPDLADPASPTYFGAHGVRSLDKKPTKIATGVSQIRSLLFDPIAQQEKLIVIDDETEDSERLINAFEKWSHKKTPLGFDNEKFEDDDHCDFLDPSRYALASFITKISIQHSFTQKANISGNLAQQAVQAAQSGDEAQKAQVAAAIAEKNRVENIVLNQLQREHGIVGNPFAKPHPDGNKSTTKGNGGIKFRF